MAFTTIAAGLIGGYGVGHMSVGTLLILIAAIALVAALPTWGYSQSWGYSPVGIAGLILMILVLLALLQKI